jgi:two-component system response regulator
MNTRILLIEDNPDHALLVELALEALTPAPHIIHIRDGQQALEHVQTRDRALLPHIVLLDLKLPRVDGLEVLRIIRLSEAWQHVPVLVLTTSNRPADVEACLAYGANAYLSKLSDLPHLASRVMAMQATPLPAVPAY